MSAMLERRRLPLLLAVAITNMAMGDAAKATFGLCPEYQTDSTSMNPDIGKILQDAGEHYIVGRLPASDTENSTTCVHMSFTAIPPSFIYSYTNKSGRQTVPGTFKVVARTVTQAGYLQMTGLPQGVLGADNRGIAQLLFISVSQVAKGLVMVLLSCINGFLLHFESAYVTASTGTTILDTEQLLATGRLYNLTQQLMWKTQKLYPVGETYKVDQSCYGTNGG